MNTSALHENVEFGAQSYSRARPQALPRRDDAKTIAQELLAQADVRIDGDRPWDISVHDDRFYERALTLGALGLGESYMDGWWDSADLAEFFSKILGAGLNNKPYSTGVFSSCTSNRIF
jgi:cyclopropane-fatty-acyl-phospholipid synthase